MKTVDCIWELKNIGKKTLEVQIEPTDVFSYDIINAVQHKYQYIVVKVPMNKLDYNWGLSQMGFCCIETQMNMLMEYEHFDFSELNSFYHDVDYEIVSNEEQLESVVSRITPGMFSTDRVSVDPKFGYEIGRQRYVNWIVTEYQKNCSQLVRVFFKGQHVGFMLVRISNGVLYLLLNGLYKQYQGKGLGLLTPASPMLYIKKKSLPITKEITSISSNNIPVVKLYNKLKFQLHSQTYVFVKHL